MVLTDYALDPTPDSTLLVDYPQTEPATGTKLISSKQWNNLINALFVLGNGTDKILKSALSALHIVDADVDSLSQSKITGLTTALNSKESVSAHDSDISSLNSSIATKESITSHNADVALLETISNHNTDVSTLNASIATKENSSDHASDISSINTQLASKADLVTGKVPISEIPLGSASTTVCVGNDSRLSDARTPLAHLHVLADISDVTISVINLNSLDDGVDSSLHFHTSDRDRANHSGTQLKSTISDFPAYGSGAGTICQGNDSRLSDARTPLAHLHAIADVTGLQTSLDSKFSPINRQTIIVNSEISDVDNSKVTGLATLLAGKEDSLPAKTNNAYKELQINSAETGYVWADQHANNRKPTGSETIPTGYSIVMSKYFEITQNNFLDVGSDAVLEII